MNFSAEDIRDIKKTMSYCITRDFMKKILSERFGETEQQFVQRESRGQFTKTQRDAILDEAIKVSLWFLNSFNWG